MPIWRLISHSSKDGAWNMAVDEAILESTAQKKAPPTLRVYAWTPPCLSIGYTQNNKDVDLSALHSFGWHLVRRPTGGRAILHADELTYAVITSQDDPLVAGGVLESYRRLSAALLRTLVLLGLNARADQTYPDAPGVSAVCFETPSNYEITAGGKKLIGSAQARRLGGMLQHGSLPLFGDLSRITQVLAFSDESQRLDATRRLLQHATTLEATLGKTIDWKTAAHTLEQAFAETFSILFEPGDLTNEEIQRANELVAQKYSNPNWTDRI